MTKVALPSDDEIWERRDSLSWSEIAERVHRDRRTIARRLNQRGWRKQPKTGGLTHAPCRDCGRTTPVAHLDDERVCGECQRLPELPAAISALYRRELRKRLPGGERYELMMRRRPVYTSIDDRYNIDTRSLTNAA